MIDCILTSGMDIIGGRSNEMVVTKMNITFVIDEEEPCDYTVEGTTSKPPYNNIKIMIRRKAKKKDELQKKGGICSCYA